MSGKLHVIRYIEVENLAYFPNKKCYRERWRFIYLKSFYDAVIVGRNEENSVSWHRADSIKAQGNFVLQLFLNKCNRSVMLCILSLFHAPAWEFNGLCRISTLSFCCTGRFSLFISLSSGFLSL